MARANKVQPQRIDPADLEVAKDDTGFAITWNGEVLLTEAETPLCHPAAPLLEHMVNEFDGHGKVEIQARKILGPKFFGSYALFGIQRKWIEPGKDDLTSSLAECLLNDPVLVPLAGPEQVDQYARWEPLSIWLSDQLDRLRALAHKVKYGDWDETGDMREVTLAQAGESKEVIAIRQQYLSLSPEERAVVMMLFAIHHGPVLFPLALVQGKCSVAEYAMGVMASQAILTGVFGDINGKAHRKGFESLRDDARTALEYVKFYREGTPNQRLRELIASGEGTLMEFKSTLRLNLHTNKNDDAITHACMKTVAAFLNTDGGQLLIGVADNGKIVGIEQDSFQNPDKFQLHLWNVLKQTCGQLVTSSVTTEILSVEDKSICLVNCKRSAEPVFCKNKGAGEEFYVRTGPATTPLPPSDMVAYVEKHFRQRG